MLTASADYFFALVAFTWLTCQTCHTLVTSHASDCIRDKIDKLLMLLRDYSMDLQVEDNITGFLGIDNCHHTIKDRVIKIQAGFIECILKALDCKSLLTKGALPG